MLVFQKISISALNGNEDPLHLQGPLEEKDSPYLGMHSSC